MFLVGRTTPGRAAGRETSDGEQTKAGCDVHTWNRARLSIGFVPASCPLFSCFRETVRDYNSQRSGYSVNPVSIQRTQDKGGRIFNGRTSRNASYRLICIGISAVKITREDVLRVAELAQLGLSPDEIETYQKQLDAILSYVEKLNELDVSTVEPMAQVLHAGSAPDAHPELRDDILRPCQVADVVLEQAADAAKPFFRVPKVIDK
jgi:aspartyl-tRNA(Asn)/glutamyl-tRNA(Gln) amidotransferase subunit C